MTIATTAKRPGIAAVRAELEAITEERDDYASDANTLFEIPLRAHDDERHPGSFTWCEDAKCLAVRRAELEYTY